MPIAQHAHAKIHFNDPDGNSLEFIMKLDNPLGVQDYMYLSEWENLLNDRDFTLK